jgi:hypothetical protein
VVNDSARYIKIVEWSEDYQCFVGQCPGVVGPCCHGDNEAQVYAELCEIVDEWQAIAADNGWSWGCGKDCMSLATPIPPFHSRFLNGL